MYSATKINRKIKEIYKNKVKKIHSKNEKTERLKNAQEEIYAFYQNNTNQMNSDVLLKRLSYLMFQTKTAPSILSSILVGVSTGIMSASIITFVDTNPLTLNELHKLAFFVGIKLLIMIALVVFIFIIVPLSTGFLIIYLYSKRLSQDNPYTYLLKYEIQVIKKTLLERYQYEVLD